MNNSFMALMALTKAYIRSTFRDKAALFFTFLFPVMFLLIFGSLNRTDRGITFDVAVINNATNEFSTQLIESLEKNEIFKINNDVVSIEEAKDLMGQGELDSVLEFPDNFGEVNEQNLPSGTVVVHYEESSPQSGQAIAAVMQGVFEKINIELTQTPPPLSVEARSTATNNLSSFDYLFAGLLGFTMLSLGIFGMANSFPAQKKTGAFRRLRVAPIRSSHLIFSNGLMYLLLGVLSIAVMVAVAIFVFDFSMQGDWLSFTLFSLCGTILMFGFGLAIGGWADNENQAAPLSQIIALPMMFLSGVFFPRFLMPDWLQSITHYLPLSPIVDGLRGITAEGKSIFELGPQLLLMAVWTVAIYTLAIKVFRWESRS
jgi:ABC-2 type transport system permease protein